MITVKTATLYKKLYFFILSLKIKKKKLLLIFFYYVSREIQFGNQKSLFEETNQDYEFSHTHENSKLFNITSKYFSFFKNKPPAS